MEASAPTSRLILSSRVKPLEEMSEPLDEDDNTIESVLTLNTEDQQQPGKRKGGKKAKKMILEKDITDFLSPAGDKIAYAALLKDVIASTDRDLLEASKKFGQLGGIKRTFKEVQTLISSSRNHFAPLRLGWQRAVGGQRRGLQGRTCVCQSGLASHSFVL